MAHIAKYKAASCGHMLAHYRRDASSLGRENIDPFLALVAQERRIFGQGKAYILS